MRPTRCCGFAFLRGFVRRALHGLISDNRAEKELRFAILQKGLKAPFSRLLNAVPFLRN